MSPPDRKPAVCAHCARSGNANRATCDRCRRICCFHFSVARSKGRVFVRSVRICGPCNLAERRAAKAGAK